MRCRSTISNEERKRERGRGIISAEDCVRMEEKNLARYMIESKKKLFGVISEGMELKESSKKYKKRVIVKRKDKLMKKQVHRKVLGNIEEVGTKETWQWLQGKYITKRMEGLIMTAQEQALRTRWFRSWIQKEDVSPKCCLCDEEVETVRHLSSGCTKLSKGPYKRRYDRMGLHVYWELCQQNGIGCSVTWFEEV